MITRKPTESRLAYLIRVAIRHITDHADDETTEYDETDCDGSCLAGELQQELDDLTDREARQARLAQALNITQAPGKAEPAATTAKLPHELEVNENEAWQIIAPLTMGEEWRNVYLDIERDAETLRILQDNVVRFTYRGDYIAKAQVVQILSPEEQDNNNGGIELADIRWRIDLDSKGYEIYPADTVGIDAGRLRRGDHSLIEDAFAQQWQRQNDAASMAYNPLLQALVMGCPQSLKMLIPGLLNNREHIIAATLIQWLGTPVGNGFLAAVNKLTNNRLAERIQCQKDPNWTSPFEHTQAPS